MSTTLYRKYRPKNFSEVIGQTHIVRTLSNAVKNNRVGHAYLFTGPRGTGKTSIARILAKTINCANLACKQRADAKLSIRRSEAKADSKIITCDACEKCADCKIIASGKTLDIIEIDAASNTGVDNIRELRETVALSPAVLRYKVYIIDEVHMLSSGAFNALLKTLEEPPAHVVFILATTQIAKVPETILSRCQRFDFVRLPIQNIIEKLSLIAKAEKINVEKEALEEIAIAAEGGMRDAESLLGQLMALGEKNITTKDTGEILGAADKKDLAFVAKMIIEKNSTSAISKINELLENGYDLQVFAKSLINHLRQLMLLKIDRNLKQYFGYELADEQIEKMIKLTEKTELNRIILAINLLIEAQGKISFFILPQLPLEIAIIKATHVFPVVKKNTEIVEDSPSPEVTSNEGTIDLYSVKKNWPKLLVAIRPYNHSLSALLSNCQPTKAEANKITLATPYDFYGEKLKEAKNKLTIEEVLGKILGFSVKIEVIVDKNISPAKLENADANEEKSSSEQNSLLDSALKIMGGKVVKE